MNKVALVVGGTGMLAELCFELAKIYDVVGILSRTSKNLVAMSNKDPKVYPICVDYTDLKAYNLALSKFTREYGKPELIVMWIHESGEQAASSTLDYVGNDLYQVTGSSGREASHWSRKTQRKTETLGITYHRVVLGSISGRWLTNHEISKGVLCAIISSKAEYIVGEESNSK